MIELMDKGRCFSMFKVGFEQGFVEVSLCYLCSFFGYLQRFIVINKIVFGIVGCFEKLLINDLKLVV